MGQAADIALVTQKDSEDDDGDDNTAPMAARIEPELSRVPETKRGSTARDADAGEPVEAFQSNAERRVPPDGDTAEDVTPADINKPEAISASGEYACEQVDAADVLSERVRDADVSTSGEQDDLRSRTLEPVVRPYRQEDAVFVSLPVRHADLFQASGTRLPPADDEVGTNYDLEDVSASFPVEAEEHGLPPVTDAHQVEDTSLTRAVTALEGAANIPEAREPDGKTSIEPEADSGNDTTTAYARGSWDKPPPLTQTPPWVWRDVQPDIVPVRGEVAETRGEPDAHERSEAQERSSEFADPRESATGDASGMIAGREAQAANTAAQASEELLPYTMPLRERVAARVAEPPADAEPLQSPAPQPSLPSHEMPLPGPAAEAAPEPSVLPETSRSDEAVAASASLAVPEPMAPPYAGGRADYNARVEPEWERPAAPRVFQDSRPGDFARDRFEVPPASDWQRYKDVGRTALRYAGYAIGGYFAFVFVLILLYRVVNPPASSLMLVQALTGTEVQQQWVSLDEISPSLVRAVIVSEDWTFCEHYGIDIKAIEQAIEKSGNGIPRGASTISMQTTKNLFLWNARSYVRKVVELPLTLMIELIWPKSRILEIYLNVAEWGPGIFGAEAAAQYHFNKPAARLDSREAAQLAASLPNPIIREAGDPGPRTARKASVIQSRMRNAGAAAECVLGGRR